MPTSNTPTTVKLFTRGNVPAAVNVPCGVMTTTVSPRRTPSARARSAPRTMPNPSGLERVERARAHVLADVGDRALARRIDAADERAAVHAAGREHRLPEHVRRRRPHARVLERRPRDSRVVGERRHAADLDVRGDGEDPGAELLLESVHHRQHDDQRGDAERDARHRHERDERDERVAARAAARARVAQSDGELVRRQGDRRFGWTEVAAAASAHAAARALLHARLDRSLAPAARRCISSSSLPGLLAPGAERGSDAPHLARLIAAAGTPAREPDGLDAALAARYGIARNDDWPLAPIRAAALGVDTGDAYWLAADPVTLEAGHDDVRLAGRGARPRARPTRPRSSLR